MRTNLYLVHNPYKRYKRKFLRSENEKWVIFNQNKFLINYMVNKLDYNNNPPSTEDLCKFLHINGKLKEMVLEIYDMCKLKPYDTRNHDPQISIVKNNSWIGPSLQRNIQNSN